MASSKSGFGNFLARKNNGPSDIKTALKGNPMAQTQSDTEKQLVRGLGVEETEATRGPTPFTKLESIQESKPRNFGKAKSSNAVPQARPDDFVKIKQEQSQQKATRSISPDRYDATDLSDFDHTTVMSENHQDFNSASQSGENGGFSSTWDPHLVSRKETQASTNYGSMPDVSDYQTQTQKHVQRHGNARHAQVHIVDDEAEDEEDEDGSDAGSNDGLANDDPTLDSRSMDLAMSGFIQPEEIGPFNTFLRDPDGHGPKLYGPNSRESTRAMQNSYPSTERSTDDDEQVQKLSPDSETFEENASRVPVSSALPTSRKEQPSKAPRIAKISRAQNRPRAIPIGQPRPQDTQVKAANLEASTPKRRHDQKPEGRDNPPESKVQPVPMEELVHQSRSTQTPQAIKSSDLTPKASESQKQDTSLNSTHATWGDNSPPHTPTPSKPTRSSSPTRPKSPSASLDYEPSTFSTIPFSTLQSQPFHIDPRAPPSSLPSHLESASLNTKLSELCPLPATNTSEHPVEFDIPQISELFASLAIEEYEECGDYLLEGFEALIKRFKEARQEKRKAAVEFEKVVEEREAVVQKRKEVVEGGLKRLRRAGEGLVRGGG